MYDTVTPIYRHLYVQYHTIADFYPRIYMAVPKPNRCGVLLFAVIYIYIYIYIYRNR